MLDERCDDLARAVAARDSRAVTAAVQSLWAAAEEARPEELTSAVARICDLVERMPLGIGGQVSILAGSLVELGGEPLPAAETVLAGLRVALEAAADFVAAWRAATGEDKPPAPADDRAAFESAMASLELDPGQAYELTEGWFATGAWVLPSMTLLQYAEVRVGLAEWERLAALVASLGPYRDDLTWLAGLLAVVDEETLVVLHRPSGRGYELTIGGIGDNFQLHTLLAATLSGPSSEGRLEGVRPQPDWVAAATDGPCEPATGPISGQFNLVNAYGRWIWNEGVPADIPALDGHRVVVLDPPPYERMWNIGRTYRMMRPVMTLDRIMSPEEAAGWLARVIPA